MMKTKDTITVFHDSIQWCLRFTDPVLIATNGGQDIAKTPFKVGQYNGQAGQKVIMEIIQGLNPDSDVVDGTNPNNLDYIVVPVKQIDTWNKFTY